jgi:hypothetical protein
LGVAPAVVIKADDFVAWFMDTADAFTGLATEAVFVVFVSIPRVSSTGKRAS